MSMSSAAAALANTDAKRQTVSEALAVLMERAKRMELRCVSATATVAPVAATPPRVSPSPKQQLKPKPGGLARATPAARKLGNVDSQHKTQRGQLSGSPTRPRLPPPPPPSPRSPRSREMSATVELANNLREEYKRTESLTNQLIQDAININQELLSQRQHQCDIKLVHEIEMEAHGRRLRFLLDAENQSKELREIRERCFKSRGSQVDLKLEQAICNMRLLVVDEEAAFAAAEYGASSSSFRPIMSEYRSRLFEIRRLVNTDGHESKEELSNREALLQKNRLQCQRNLIFYQSMNVVENELLHMMPPEAEKATATAQGSENSSPIE